MLLALHFLATFLCGTNRNWGLESGRAPRFRHSSSTKLLEFAKAIAFLTKMALSVPRHTWPYGLDSSSQSQGIPTTKICVRYPVNTDFCASSHSSVKCSPSSKGSCAVCGSSCRNLCAGCRSVNYCTKKHQQLHWAKHKVFCRAFSVPTQYPAPLRGSASSGGSAQKSGGIKDSAASNSGRMELKWMVANKDIPGGKTLFSEKPLLIVPNYSAKDAHSKKSVCFGCYRHFPSSSDVLSLCPVCQLPLCKDCSLESGSRRHPQNECVAVADVVARNRPSMASLNERIGQSVDLVRDYTILKVLLLHKSSSEAWDSFYALKNNTKYTTVLSVKSLPDYVKAWMDSLDSRGYFISKTYLSSAFKDKSIKLEDVVRIFAIFSDVSWFNPEHRVVYILRSWIPHSCNPNAEFHFSRSDPSQTLYVKTVDHIKTDGLVSINYIDDYEEGTSKSAIRLFQTSGLLCSNPECACKIPWMDYSVGIRCSKVLGDKEKSSSNCPGSLCPLLDAPNPEKPSLGLLIYVKSRSWSCNKCRRNEKYSSIHKQIKDIIDKIKDRVDVYCESPSADKYLELQKQLSSSLGDQHWLNWKFTEATLSCWSKLVGYGGDMLKSVMFRSAGSPSVDIPIVQQKADLYAQTIWSNVLSSPATITPVALQDIERRYGRLSTYRGYYVYDAFFVNFILFAEDFKSKLRMLLTSPTMLKDVISDGIRCLQNFVQMLEVASLSLGLNEYIGAEDKQLAQSAAELLEVFQDVYLKASRNRGSLILYVKEFLQIYAMNDTPFLTSVLGKFTPMGDELDDLFDFKGADPEHRYLDLIFGSTTATTSSGKNVKSSFDFGIDDFLNKTKRSDGTGKNISGGVKRDNKSEQNVPKPSRLPIPKSSQTRKPAAASPPANPKPTFKGTSSSSKEKNESSSSSEDEEAEYLSTEYLLKLAGMSLSDESDEETDLDSLKNKIDYCEFLLSESMKDSLLTDEILNDMYNL